MLGIRVRLGDVLSLDVQSLEGAIKGSLEHVGNAKSGLGAEREAPGLFELVAHGVARDVAVAGELMGEGTHVAGPLHVVLAAQRVDPNAVATDVPSRHGQVRHAHHHGRALAVLGDPESVVDRRVGRRGVQPRGRAKIVSWHARQLLGGLGAVLGRRDKGRPSLVGLAIAAFSDESTVHQALGDHHVTERIDDRDVRARAQLQEVSRFEMWRAHEANSPRVDHDELSPLRQATLHP